MCVCGAAVGFCFALPAVAQVDLKVYPAPDFGEGVVWLDEGAAAPHHIADYRGKVVLIDFWEYTCINCIRDFGVVKRWYTKYHPYGFEVIGVHYGEFNIGFDVNNVKEAAQRFKLPWPVVADQKLKTYQKYHDKGFEVIGVSLDKTDGKDALISFAKENNMPWRQYFDGQFWGNKLAVKYGVTAIPMAYLLDGEGKIIAKNVRGEELDAAVAKALGGR